MHAVSDYCGVALTLKDTETFKLDYAHASKVTKGDGWAVFATSASNLLITIPPCRFYIASDDAAKCERQHTEIIAAFAGNAEDKKKSGQFFFNKTRELIEKNSYSVVGGKVVNVDIVRDVLRVVPLYSMGCYGYCGHTLLAARSCRLTLLIGKDPTPD